MTYIDVTALFTPGLWYHNVQNRCATDAGPSEHFLYLCNRTITYILFGTYRNSLLSQKFTS